MAARNGAERAVIRGLSVAVGGLERIRRALLAPRSQALQALLMLDGLAVATMLRVLLGGQTERVQFLTFLPAIVLSALFLDVVWAVASAVLTLLIVNNLFMPTPWRLGTQPVPFVLLAIYALTVGIVIGICHLLRRILKENEAHIAQTEAFNAELQHRTKNVLQIMRSLVARGPQDADPQRYYDNLGGRIDALAKANELLRYGALETCRIADLVGSALAPFDRERFTTAGPDVRVSRAATTPLMMALHELCTNATKYGSLSADAGTVSVTWSSGRAGQVTIDWHEHGGPPVAKPRRQGLGTRLLVPHGGLREVRLDWRETGLVCRLVASGPEAAAPGARNRAGYYRG